MFKKVKLLLICFISVVFFSCFCSVDSSAAGNEYYVSYSEPTANELCGYLNVSASNGGGTLYTYFWNIVPDFSEHNASDRECYMYIRLNGNSVIFHPYVYGNTGYLTLGYYDSNGGMSIIYNGSIGLNTYENTQNFTGIWGLSSGGNAIFGTTGSWSTVLVRWNQSVDVIALNSKMNEVLMELAKIEGDTTSMVSQLQSIYNQNISTNQKLDNMNALLNEIKSEQKKTNTWLEKIYGLLEEQPEKEKEEAQSSGDSSISKGTNSIEDKGTGFANSLNGLVSSMSYSGTQCSWTFPQVKLPAIKGVMEEIVLIEEQPIDFTTWINAIPSPILLLIQSVMTMSLIVYCFKELYGTISYVLTLRGGGSNE